MASMRSVSTPRTLASRRGRAAPPANDPIPGKESMAELSLQERTLLFYGTRLPNHPRKWWLHDRLRRTFFPPVVERQGSSPDAPLPSPSNGQSGIEFRVPRGAGLRAHRHGSFGLRLALDRRARAADRRYAQCHEKCCQPPCNDRSFVRATESLVHNRTSSYHPE